MSARRAAILTALRARLATIRRAAGYQTDVGAHVHLGVPALGPDDPPLAVALVPGETAAVGGGHRLVAWTVTVSAVARDDLADAPLGVEAVVADVQRALEGGDPTIGGLVRSLEPGAITPLAREPGTPVMGTVLTYIVRFVEPWGGA